jgi:ligand-binding sensor domain-containing protein
MKASATGHSLAFIYLWWLLLLAHKESSGQQAGGVFFQLTTKNGLSSNRTTSVIQDRKGYYWIGTEDGLNRFDGTSC